MLQTIKGWLAPPIFEDDEEKSRLARITNTISLAIIVVLGVYTIARPNLFLQDIEAALANGTLLLLLIGSLFLIRRGWVRAAALMLTTLAWINLTFQVWLFGGVRDAAFAAYLLIILIASLMLGWRAALLFLCLSILTGLGIAYAEVVGILPFSPDDPYALWLDHSLNFVIATILVTMMVTSLNKALARARRNEADLVARNYELQAIRTQLEAQLAEREQIQQSVQASERLYRQTVDNSPNPIFSVDRAGLIQTWNPACEVVFQYGPEIIGQHFKDILWDQREVLAIEKGLAEIAEHKHTLNNLEITYRRKDGSRCITVSRLYPTLCQYQEVETFVFANTDITGRIRIEQTLRESEEKYRLVVENANEAIVVAQDGQLKFFNTKLLEFAGGYSRAELCSRPFTEFIHPDDRVVVLERHLKRLKGETCPQVYTFRILDKGGKITWVEVNAIRITWQAKPAILFFLGDITERKQAQDKLAESEQRYRQLVKYAPAGIYEIDYLNSRFIDVNDVMCDYSGYSREEFLSLSVLDLVTEDGKQLFLERTKKMLAGEPIPETAEFKVKRKNGQELWVLVNTRIVYENERPTTATVVAHDITERKRAEEELEKYRFHLEELVNERTVELSAVNSQLQLEIAERRRAETQIRTSLNEKEVLLREIHHRVKNNLQVISSLLNLQSSRLEDQQTLATLQDSQHRVRSMALIHQKLYQAANLAQIDFGEYIHDLATYLFRAQDAYARGISLNVQADNILLDIDKATPCGLIINELISNALKHAFPNGQSGQICLELHTGPDDSVVLTVTDNGIGFPPELDSHKTESLGLQLVNILVDQLGGALELRSEQGTQVKLTFVYQPLKEQVI